MPIHQAQVATIPCRVSDPRASVTLVKMPSKRMTIGDDLTYDPRTGFRILYPNYIYSDMFQCVATLGNKTVNPLVVILSYKGTCFCSQMVIVTTSYVEFHDGC